MTRMMLTDDQLASLSAVGKIDEAWALLRVASAEIRGDTSLDAGFAADMASELQLVSMLISDVLDRIATERRK